MNETLYCEESVIDKENGSFWAVDTKRCPNRAKYRVTTPNWSHLMCGTHARPWRRDDPRYHDIVKVETL